MNTENNIVINNQNNQQIGKVGDFDYYLLQMSYAPEFCRTHKDKEDTKECTGNYNLVLYGLWTQYYKPLIVNGKTYYGPQFCKSKYDNITQEYINKNILAKINNWDAIAPDFDRDNRGEHQFQKHGTSTGLNPFDYFALAFRLASSLPQYIITDETTIEEIKNMYPNGKIQTDLEGNFVAINFVFDKNVSYYHNVW